MKSHFLNLPSANTTLFLEVTPLVPLDLPTTKGSVPAKSKGAVTQGKQVTDCLLVKPHFSQQAPNPTDSPRSDKELSRGGKEKFEEEKCWVGEGWQKREMCIFGGGGEQGQKLEGHDALRLQASVPRCRSQINSHALVLKCCSEMSPSSPLISLTKQVLHCHLWQKALVNEKL